MEEEIIFSSREVSINSSGMGGVHEDRGLLAGTCSSSMLHQLPGVGVTFDLKWGKELIYAVLTSPAEEPLL